MERDPWSNKMLSKAGKTVMISSMAQAIPKYPGKMFIIFHLLR
jgi:hypothetical protein